MITGIDTGLRVWYNGHIEGVPFMGKFFEMYNDNRWKHPVAGLRATQLSQDPLCFYCLIQNRVTAADTVDHILAHEGDPDLFYDPENLRSSCKLCHDSVAQKKDKYGYIPGFDEDGVPIDPKHPWRAHV